MKKIYNSVDMLVGNTPLLHLCNIEKKHDLKAHIYAKLEYLNPAGSIKDRAALHMLNTAECEGKITPDTVIIEPTSGNTGIGLSSVAASRGYTVIIVMPDTMSVERINTMRAYGAQVVLTDGKKGMAGAIEKARELSCEYENSFIPDQFENPANAEAHFLTTGPEIWRDTDGELDFFVSAVGTGGTITGVARYLKSKNENIKVVAIEPSSSPVLSGGAPAPHKIQGIGAGFVPGVLDTSVYDEVIAITDDSALALAREVGKCEGILVGISSGAALSGAIEIAKREENAGKDIVVIFPDTGDRYLSTELFS